MTAPTLFEEVATRRKRSRAVEAMAGWTIGYPTPLAGTLPREDLGPCLGRTDGGRCSYLLLPSQQGVWSGWTKVFQVQLFKDMIFCRTTFLTNIFNKVGRLNSMFSIFTQQINDNLELGRELCTRGPLSSAAARLGHDSRPFVRLC